MLNNMYDSPNNPNPGHIMCGMTVLQQEFVVVLVLDGGVGVDGANDDGATGTGTGMDGANDGDNDDGATNDDDGIIPVIYSS